MSWNQIEKAGRILSAVLVAVGFLCISVSVGVMTVSKNREVLFSPVPEGEGFYAACLSKKEDIVQAFDDTIAGFDRFLTIYGLSQNLIGTSVYEDAGYGYLIRDSRDYLHYHTYTQDATVPAKAVASLSDTLAANGIPLLYLQAPTKEMDGFTVYPLGMQYRSRDNATSMLSSLQALGVDAVSLEDVLDASGISPASRFYRTDHHWTTETAFSAFSSVLSELNRRYGLSLDEDLGNINNWRSEVFPESFLGSIGRRVGKEISGLDDYTYLEPAFDTAYRVYYPPSSLTEPYWVGTFRETMVRDSLLYAEDVSANRYASYFQYDYGRLLIENVLQEGGPTIAIIKDSFALPFAAFLSTAAWKIDMIDLREFEGSVADHLLETKPDVVLILYSNNQFNLPDSYDFWG